MTAVRELFAVRGIESTTPAFRAELIRMADRLGADPNAIAAVMSFETAGTFDPAKRNPVSSATGLIQFMSSTAKTLGTTTAELAAMTATEQLAYVEKYLQSAKGRLHTVADTYMAVFAPVGLGKPASFVLYSDPKTVAANAGLDRLPKDQKITKEEAALPVQGIYNAAQRRPRLMVDMSIPPSADSRHGDQGAPQDGGGGAPPGEVRTPAVRTGIEKAARTLGAAFVAGLGTAAAVWLVERLRRRKEWK